MQDINPLKRINLQQYQKPKTLIVVHYKGKRISVPLLGDCKNLTQMLYHHIDKFEQTVLKSDPKWEVLSQRKIVCFCSSSISSDKNENKIANQESTSINKSIDKCLRYADGELKMDILLSLIRIQSNDSKPVLDITKFYKYMEIQPFYVQYPIPNMMNEKQNPMKHKYFFYRLIEKNRVKNNYLARNLENGYFYSIKVYRSGLSMAEHEVRFLSVINSKAQLKFPEYLKHPFFTEQNLSQPQELIGPTEIYMIPSEEEEEDEQDEEISQRYKHLAIVQKYNIRGKLSDRINDKNSRITETDLLRYLKQLVWIVYQLHEEYNIVHRNLTPESFEIDEFGDLKLTCFSSWVECHGQDGSLIQYPFAKDSNRTDYSHDSRVYQEEFELAQDGWYNIGHYTPPEVSLKSKDGYNKFVDYYTIGIVIKELYQKIYEFQNKSQSQSSLLIQKMIGSLTSKNLKQREEIVLQLVQSIKKSKLQDTERKNKQMSLNLSEIKLGQFINIDMSQSCVENQDHDFQFNGISHQEIINYFKPRKEVMSSLHQTSHSQLKQQKQKEKKKSANFLKNPKHQTSNFSNSRDNSVKSVKSNKSKNKSRIKSKLVYEKDDKLEKAQSKSLKKATSPGKTSFNNGRSNANSKMTTVSTGQKKSKSKSCDKLKMEKSPDKKSKEIKEKVFHNTMLPGNHRKDETLKTMSRTGVNIPLPRQKITSPTRIN